MVGNQEDSLHSNLLSSLLRSQPSSQRNSHLSKGKSLSKDHQLNSHLSNNNNQSKEDQLKETKCIRQKNMPNRCNS